MCAIAGVSFAPGSTIDRRKLANALLKAGEERGTDASGVAWVDPDGGDGIYKKDVPGGQLFVGKIPQDATAMILHTRAATHGDPRENENNHPIESPSGNLRLVHNGVIYNHEDVRKMLGSVGKSLPEVDSSVIPAVIETQGLNGTSELGGYASAAWFDRETGNTIHLARFKTSTVHFATLWDGSFIFASTARIIATALMKLDIPWYGSYPSPFEDMDGGSYFQVIDGEIVAESEVKWKSSYTYNGRDYSAQTSGGKSRATGIVHFGNVGNDDTPSRQKDVIDQMTDEEFEEWANRRPLALTEGGTEETYGIDRSSVSERASKQIISKLFGESEVERDEDGLMTDEAYEEWLSGKSIGVPEFGIIDGTVTDPELHPELVAEYGESPMFYATTHDGDYSTFNTPEALLMSLRWHSGLTAEDHIVDPDSGELRWVNHFADVGALNQKGDTEFSWVVNESDFMMFEQLFPTWVREGISKLRQLVGA